MFFFRHPKPVVDRRPLAEHSVQVKAVTLPVLTASAPAPVDVAADADQASRRGTVRQTQAIPVIKISRLPP